MAGVLIGAGRDDAPAALKLHAAAPLQHPLPLPLQARLVICATVVKGWIAVLVCLRV